MTALRFYLLCWLLLFAAAASHAQDSRIVGTVYLRSGEQIPAQKIQHFWLIGRGGWLIARDTTGKRHKFFDKDIESYSHKGNVFRCVLVGKKPERNSSYVMWVRQLSGRVELYGAWDARGDVNPLFYVHSSFYKGLVSRRNYRERLLPLLQSECPIFAERTAVTAESDFFLQVQVFNRLCP